MPRQYHVYILANASREIYVGVTGDPRRRVTQHRSMHCDYTAAHGITRLVYCKSTAHVLAAIAREKQIKVWTRRRKLELIESLNPEWEDMAVGW